MSLNYIRGTYNHDTLKYLRYNATHEWRDKALKAANYKCEISGRKTTKKDYLVVHHLDRTFSSIVYEALDTLNLKFYKTIDKYSQDELDKLVQLVKDIHKDVKGMVLTVEIHSRIHKKFGYDAPKEEVLLFKKNFKRYQYQQKNLHRSIRTA